MNIDIIIKTKAVKIIIAIASIIGILPAMLTSIDVCCSSFVHLTYSAWFHIRLSTPLNIVLPAAFVLCCKGILYSFDQQLKIKEDPGVADFVFPPLFLAAGLLCILPAADLYFSRAALYSHSALFHMNVNKYRIGPLCFISIFPFVALFLYTLISGLIDITKKPYDEEDQEQEF